MEEVNAQFTNLTPDEVQKLKDFEKDFAQCTGKDLYLLAFDQK